MKDIQVVEVKMATNAKAFIPFTTLPEDFASHQVALVKLSRRQEKDLKAALHQGLKVEVDFRIVLDNTSKPHIVSEKEGE